MATMNLTDEQIQSFRAFYAERKTVSPSNMVAMVGRYTDETLKAIVAADIKFLSRAAKNELHRRAPRGPQHTCHMVSNVRRFCPACGR